MRKQLEGSVTRWRKRLRLVLPATWRRNFTGTFDYWRERYARGGDSGAGSYRHLAQFKADALNAFVQEHGIRSVIEFGCGDGNLLRYTNYPSYFGLDISQHAIQRCVAAHGSDRTKKFALLDDYRGETAELALSLDVIFHLVEDSVFAEYMRRLFAAAEKFVIIYSSDTDDNTSNDAPHIRHRRFSKWIAQNAQGWKFSSIVKNKFPFDGNHAKTSFSDFFIYERVDR